MQEEAYQVQFLYNAINEYVYFTIILIENYGPQSLNELEKYIMFFKKELQSFIQIFKGETRLKKVHNFLYTVSNAFNLQEEIMYLSNTYRKYKATIFQELFQSNVTDLVLREISSIKEICKYINLNAVFQITEDKLLIFIKQSSLFHIDDDSTVTILQFSGMIGYDELLYKSITEYFHSYLLKVCSFTYEDIKLHESFILSNEIRTPLVILCVFYINEMFKCKNNRVKVCKNWKNKAKKQIKIEIDELSRCCKTSLPIGEVVFHLFGYTIHNFSGEIKKVNKNIGFLHGIVEIKSVVGVFPVFFNMSALKFICGSDNLVDFLNTGDSVEFDAQYCNKTQIEDRYWKATQVKVIKQVWGRKKYHLNFDIDEYTEKRLMKDKFKSIRTKSLNCGINGHSHSSDTATEIMHSNKLGSDKYLGGDNLIQDSKQLGNINKSDSEYNNSGCKVSHRDQFDNEIYKRASIHSHETEFLEVELPSDQNELLTPKTTNLAHQNISNYFKDHLIIENVPLTESSFVIGKIIIISEKEGIAVSLNAAEQFEVYFKSQALLCLEDTKCLPQEESRVLLFLPYGKKENSMSISTLVYVLDEEESSLTAGNCVRIDDFVMEYFIPKLKFKYPNYNACCCDFSFSFINSFNRREETFEGIKNCLHSLLNDLKAAFTYDKKTEKNIYAIMRLYSQVSRADKRKLYSFVTSLFYCIKAKSITKRINISCRKRQRTLKYQRTNNMNNKLDFKSNKIEYESSKSINSLGLPFFTLEELDNITSSYIPPKDNKMLCTIDDDTSRNPSPSSLSSYVSCDTVLSDEEFHSLESISSKFDSLKTNLNNSHLLLQDNGVPITTNCFSLDMNDNFGIKINLNNQELSAKDKIRHPGKNIPTLKKMYRKQDNYLSVLKKIYRKQAYNIMFSYELCKCQNSIMETTSSISMITDVCLFFNVKDNNDVVLSFPMSLIPEEIQKQIKINSQLNITFVLHKLVQLSHVLYIKFDRNV